MHIYIASSWKNEHAVRMMSELLRREGYAVASFVENNYGEGHGFDVKMDFDEWIHTESAARSFEFDTMSATTSDAVVYIGPSGSDAWAEVGAAWAKHVPVIGLWAKGENSGLMRRMVEWVPTYEKVIETLKSIDQWGPHTPSMWMQVPNEA